MVVSADPLKVVLAFVLVVFAVACVAVAYMVAVIVVELTRLLVVRIRDGHHREELQPPPPKARGWRRRRARKPEAPDLRVIRGGRK